MMASNDDNLTEQQREEQDRIAREKEAQEQARNLYFYLNTYFIELPYKWKQTLQDVDITVSIPKGTKGRDLTVVIKQKQLSAGLKNQPPIIHV